MRPSGRKLRRDLPAIQGALAQAVEEPRAPLTLAMASELLWEFRSDPEIRRVLIELDRERRL